MAHVLHLEVVGGPLRGRIVVVPDRGMVVVGRLPDCGLAVTQDMTVSRQHFRIEFQYPACHFIHLSQTSESQVNGKTVAKADLNSGDEITFGAGNKLRIKIEETGEALTSATLVAHEVDIPKGKSKKGFTSAKASCEWFLYESPDDQLDFAEVFKILTTNYAPAAVIDFRRINKPVPAELVEPQYLFPWVPEPSRNEFSPILVSLKSNPAVAELLPGAIGKNGFICFASKLKGAELASFWRKAIGAGEAQPGESLTAYYWPSILNMIMTCQSPLDVASLLDGLDWIFIENPKSPGQWRLFSKVDFTSELVEAGLTSVSETKTAS